LNASAHFARGSARVVGIGTEAKVLSDGEWFCRGQMVVMSFPARVAIEMLGLERFREKIGSKQNQGKHDQVAEAHSRQQWRVTIPRRGSQTLNAKTAITLERPARDVAWIWQNCTTFALV
jgi:hypothetical protein